MPVLSRDRFQSIPINPNADSQVADRNLGSDARDPLPVFTGRGKGVGRFRFRNASESLRRTEEPHPQPHPVRTGGENRAPDRIKSFTLRADAIS